MLVGAQEVQCDHQDYSGKDEPVLKPECLRILSAQRAEPSAAQIAKKVSKATNEEGHECLRSKPHGFVHVVLNVNLGGNEKQREADSVEKDPDEQSAELVSCKENISHDAGQ